MSLDPRSPSMTLWHRLLAAGVSEDEATKLMHGYAHELAEQIRAAAAEEFPDGDDNPQEFYGDWGSFYRDAADIIDPHAQQPPVDEYRLSTHRAGS